MFRASRVDKDPSTTRPEVDNDDLPPGPPVFDNARSSDTPHNAENKTPQEITGDDIVLLIDSNGKFIDPAKFSADKQTQ